MEHYDLNIAEHNKQGHLDIEEAVQCQRDGLFTFIIRVAEKKIVDIVFLSYESYSFQESDISYND